MGMGLGMGLFGLLLLSSIYYATLSVEGDNSHKFMYGELPVVETSTGDKVPALVVTIQNPSKFCLLRLPTSAEILTHASSLRSLYRDLGRRRGESQDIPNPEADRKLFESVRLDKSGAEFDEAEVGYALGILTRHRSDGYERDGENFRITLTTLWGKTVHLCRVPFQKEMAQYQRNVYKPRDLPHGVEERRFPPEVPCELYDAVVISINGYCEPVAAGEGKEVTDLARAKALVPPHHKRSVAGELASALIDLDPSLDPNS